jgi:hypothetical protein
VRYPGEAGDVGPPVARRAEADEAVQRGRELVVVGRVRSVRVDARS